MGSFKEYYEDVKNYQNNLTKKEESDIIKALSDTRFSLKDAIFSIPEVPDKIIENLKKITSVASVAESFNSNKKGNNTLVKTKIENILSKKVTIKDLHDCNFRIDWLITTILPTVSVPAGNLNWITITKEKLLELENRLVGSCLKMAVKLALNNRGKHSHEDAIQIANLALVEAAKKFDPSIKVKFNTYAYYKIVFKMKQSQMENPFGIVHIPKSAEVEEGAGSWLSLEEDVDVGRNRPLSEILPNEESDIEDIVNLNLVRNNLKESLGRYLSEQEADIIYFRYLFAGKILTYQEIGTYLPKSLTRERIRQIEVKALRKLKDQPELRDLLKHYEGVNFWQKDNDSARGLRNGLWKANNKKF